MLNIKNKIAIINLIKDVDFEKKLHLNINNENDLMKKLQLNILDQKFAKNKNFQLNNFNVENTLKNNIELFRYKSQLRTLFIIKKV